MKNLIVNIFKTLLFFDVAVIATTYLPNIQKDNPALTKLINEAIFLGLILVFTLIFVLFVEKRKLGPPITRKRFKSFILGFSAGAVVPVVYMALLVILKHFHYNGFIKTSDYHYWILALLCNAIATELFFRGYLFSLYKKYYSFTLTTIFTTALYLSFNFKIFSEDRVYMANIILFNVLLCFLLEYSGSVITTITARFVYTLISTFLLGSLPLTGGYPVLLNYTFDQKEFFVGAEYPLENSKLMLCILGFLTLLFAIEKYHPIKQLKRFIAYLKTNPFKRMLLNFRKRKVKTKK